MFKSRLTLQGDRFTKVIEKGYYRLEGDLASRAFGNEVASDGA
jgi:hypothetical protein